MEIEWTDEDPVNRTKRSVRASRFARKWTFKTRFRRYDNWKTVPEPSRDMWETLLDALERRYPRREGVTDEDLKQVRAIVAALPAAEVEESTSPQRHEDHTKEHKEDTE